MTGILRILEEISQPISSSTFYYTTTAYSRSSVATPFNSSSRNHVPVLSDGHSNGDIMVRQYDNYGTYINRTKNPVTTVLLQLNGHDRFSQRDGFYFNYVQPYQHHTNTPADGVNMYSFALNPEEHQPSGTCNMSRIDNATLSLGIGEGDIAFKDNYLADDTVISIYATNYNVLRIMSGMGGLAYSN